MMSSARRAAALELLETRVMGSIRLAILALGCTAAASSADIISFGDHRDPRLDGRSAAEALYEAHRVSATNLTHPIFASGRGHLAVGPIVNPHSEEETAQSPAEETTLFTPQQDFWTGMLARSTAMMF